MKQRFRYPNSHGSVVNTSDAQYYGNFESVTGIEFRIVKYTKDDEEKRLEYYILTFVIARL